MVYVYVFAELKCPDGFPGPKGDIGDAGFPGHRGI